MARPIRDFCHIQQIKYIAHIFRLDNSELQKQILLDWRAPTTAWTSLEDTGNGRPADQKNDDASGGP